MKLSVICFENVKHVLFGNQKQANVTNDAVVNIVAQFLSGHGANLETDVDVVKSCHEILSKLVSGEDTLKGAADSMAVMLLCGEQSYVNLKSGATLDVLISQPNPESPKRLFRIIPKQGDNADIEREVATVTTTSTVDTGDREADTITAKVERIKKALLAIAPEQVKEELADNEWAQALYVAEFFYKSGNVVD